MNNSNKTLIILAILAFIVGGVWFLSLENVDETDSSPIYLGNNYLKTDDGIFFYRSGFIHLEDVDLNSFEVLEGGASRDNFAIDNNSVYLNGEILEDEDPTIFNPGSSEEGPNVFNGGIILGEKPVITTEEGVVYVNNEEISGADFETFEYVGMCSGVEEARSYYFKDDTNIYVDGSVVSYIDPETFEYLSLFSVPGGFPSLGSYAKDANSVYYNCGEVIPEANPDTFEFAGDGWSRDEGNVYRFANVFTEADRETFEFLTPGYVKDSENVYHIHRLTSSGIDINTVEVITFSDLSLSYVKDENNVYSITGYIIEGIDPGDCTLQTINRCHPR